MSSLPRPIRNAARTNRAARRSAFSSDTSARQNRDPTSWLCRPEFSRSRLNEVAMRRKTNAFHPIWTVSRFAQSRCPKYFYGAGWSSLVARQAHNLKVAGSNPAPATNFFLNRAAPAALFCVMPRPIPLVAKRYEMAPAVGFEPTTNRLTADRSTTELRWITQLKNREWVFSRTIGLRQLTISNCPCGQTHSLRQQRYFKYYENVVFSDSGVRRLR